MSIVKSIFLLIFNILTAASRLAFIPIFVIPFIRRISCWLSTIHQQIPYVNYATHSNEDAEDSYGDKRYVDFTSIWKCEDSDYHFLDDIPVMVEIPRNVIPVDCGSQCSDNNSLPLSMLPITPMKYQNKQESSDTVFLRPDDTGSTKCGPYIYDSKFLTPVRYRTRDVEVTFTLLKAASDRVTEILRENRRRLDVGEDPCAVRRELRRRRAQELSTRRKNRSPYT
ncbi:hypothetical protein BJ165DRAFT_1028576 [Panaeolus papilionaceus]|nr:hypothetical protein BJ165DRAFT_1028576 [Panaeolus papilionaceus]